MVVSCGSLISRSDICPPSKNTQKERCAAICSLLLLLLVVIVVVVVVVVAVPVAVIM